jgi:hypothetical protein
MKTEVTNSMDRYISTGHLPSPRQVQAAVDEAYQLYAPDDVESGVDGRFNPMVNAGAIAATSLVPGDTAQAGR